MILKYNQQVAALQMFTEKQFITFSKKFIECLIRRNAIYECPDFYRYSLRECVAEDAPVTDVINSFKVCGIKELTSEIYDAVMNAQVFGEDDCPECGCRMECTDGCYHQYGDGYTSECINIPIMEEFICINCGHKEIRYY
jgi:hypothetical protein